MIAPICMYKITAYASDKNNAVTKYAHNANTKERPIRDMSLWEVFLRRWFAV